MSLVLDSLEIKNFRAFKHLRIEKLGRVNLIVGKNNVGKSSVLEALVLFARRAYPALIWELLGLRNESAVLHSKNPIDLGDTSDDIRHFFHGRKPIAEQLQSIEIGPSQDLDETLSLTTYWPNIYANKKVAEMLKLDEYDTAFMAPGVVVSIGSDVRAVYPLDGSYIAKWLLKSNEGKMREIPCIYVGAYGIDASRVSKMWDSITLSSLEKDVVAALQIVASEVEDINLVGDGGTQGVRIPKASILGNNSSITLRSMGEGMNRMFGIALALVNAKDGMVLIDEVDTGLHYSVLPDLWKLIFEVAHRLNVQVFATSHSWDCIQAFQQAAADNTQEEGVLVRLENRKNGVGAVTFDEQELAIVTREQIEVR